MTRNAGASHVFICSFPDRRSEWQVTSGAAGGAYPVWSGDGRRLFYATNSGEIMVVKVVIRADAEMIGLSACRRAPT